MGSCLIPLLALSLLTTQAGPLHRPHILGIAHVAFRVSDIDRSESFYENVLGYQQPFSLNDDRGQPTLGFIKVNDLQYVELFRGDAQTQGHLDHFALYTDDLTAMSAYLHGLGMYLVNDIHKGRTGNSFLTLRDPGGHLLEIVQYASNSMTAQGRGKFMPAGRVSDHISHVAIVASSIDSTSIDLTMKFYREALGFRELSRGGGAAGRPGWIDLQTPDGADYIELILSPGVTSSLNKSADHMGLASSDVRHLADVLRARSRGSLSVSVSGQEREDVVARLDLLDPDGARIEIRQAPTANAISMQHPTHSQ